MVLRMALVHQQNQCHMAESIVQGTLEAMASLFPSDLAIICGLNIYSVQKMKCGLMTQRSTSALLDLKKNPRATKVKKSQYLMTVPPCRAKIGLAQVW